MASVDAQLEANGLPTQFESSSNQPTISHAVSNAAATLSNSEISAVQQDAPDLEINAKSVLPAEDLRRTSTTPTTNDVSLTQAGGLSQPGETQLNDSVSASLEVQPPETQHASVDMPLLTEASTEVASVPNQAPTSNLRTEPHSDALSPEAVAQIEAQKHMEDNEADTAPASLESTAPATSQVGNETSQINGISSPPVVSQTSDASVPTESVPEPQITQTEETLVSDITPVDIAADRGALPSETDQEMTDAPTQSTKVARDREEDVEGEEPTAKRVKTENEQIANGQATFKVPQSSASAGNLENSEQDPEDAVTPLRQAHMKRVISNLKKSNASAAFRLPVDYVALKIPTYPDVVKHPMDLGTIDTRLKEGAYSSVKAFTAEFGQIVINCVLFNGPDHQITQAARKMESSFQSQMSNLPPASAAEPSKQEKKAAKIKMEPIRAPPPRRPSVSASTKATSPKATTSPATFAPDPNGMPLIRRDSAIDGRPKRAIVPTKRNSDFGAGRPKKKKYELELRFCDEVLKTVSSSKHWAINQFFTHPVDPVALNIPTYFQIIKKPMDLSTMRTKLDQGHYDRAKDFEDDMRLIVKNCYKFNPEGDYVYTRGQELEKLFNQEWSKKQDWIMAREPDSERGTPAEEEEEDSSEEEEDEADESSDDRSDKIKQLQAQIEAMSKQMGELAKEGKKKKSPSIKKEKKKKKDKPATHFPNLKPKEKEKEKQKPTKAKQEKDRYVTFAEKQYISNGIGMLPERQMSEALKIIQASVPALANSAENEIELDIEEVPNHALLKLLAFVRKYAGPPPEEVKAESETAYTAPVAPSKKSKQLSRHDQKAKIAELRGTLQSFANDEMIPGTVQSIEQADDEDSDEDDSAEESEED